MVIVDNLQAYHIKLHKRSNNNCLDWEEIIQTEESRTNLLTPLTIIRTLNIEQIIYTVIIVGFFFLAKWLQVFPVMLKPTAMQHALYLNYRIELF